MNRPRKSLVVGLDVGDGPLLERFADEGHMPVLARFLAEGTRAELATAAELLHVAAWPSLYTGTRPGAHGVYYTFQPRPGVQGAVRFAGDQYGVPPFWRAFDEAGRRCIVLDAPYTHPLPGFGGLQVFEWGTWAHYWHPDARPPSDGRSARRLLGRYPLARAGLEANRVGMRALDPEDLEGRLADALLAKAEAARRLADRRSWDLFVVVFGETHAGAHYLYPSGNEPAPGAALERMRRHYATLDAALGRLLDGLDEDVDVYLVSGDGVGPNRAAWHLLPEILERLGFAARPGAGAPQDAGGGDGDGGAPPSGGGLLGRIRERVPDSWRQAISARLPTSVRDALMRKKAVAAFDWKRTRAFPLPTDLEGCLRVNLVGREPAGSVQPGADYDRTRDELVQALERLRDPDTGRSAVERVLRMDAAAPGERRPFLPDVVVHWSAEVSPTALEAPGAGVARGPSPDPRPGTHRPHGFLAARGAGIERGGRFFGGHVVDFAPTVLERNGLPVPSWMEGRPWKELVPDGTP